ncbi:hypothetical protein PsYK624_154000 [Phanerochaete sordida]|uniref:Uncharacterized protein n=1 Tax=Phanerochaete sordida TaxID=48140 RepID=A0A9P3GNR9_9APHY|nr:hypothetical protein PsYK624_154000 [Phanerochaete sordida]
MNYKKLRVFGKGRRSMLEDEDEDNWLGAPGIGTTTQYRDYPASVASSAQQPFVMHNRGASAASRLPSNPTTPMQEFQAPPPQPTSSYLMGMRAASSGSIFHEAVWPPPSEDSRFVDPLVAGSSQVDLGRIVPDVMGPNQQTRSVAYGTPVVVGAAAVPIHGRTPSAAGLLSYASGPASPTATTVTHQMSQTAYTTQTTPSHGPKPSHSLKRSWDRAKNQPVDESLYALDAVAEPASDDFDRAGTGSPVPLEPQGTRLFIRNAEPLSPSTPPTELEGFPQHARRDSTNGSPGGSPRWLDRQVRKD